MSNDYWGRYLLHSFDFAPFPAGSLVLDVGCGSGAQLHSVAERGCVGVGIEPTLAENERVVSPRIRIVRGIAERLPFGDAQFDGIICKVVTPYTDERMAIRELARVLKPGGIAVVSHHGVGYFLRYLFRPPAWRNAAYAARTLVNTWVYRMVGRRLPGAVGDTIYQSRRTLARYYRSVGLDIRARPESPRFLGAPVFIYEVLERRKLPSPPGFTLRPPLLASARPLGGGG